MQMITGWNIISSAVLPVDLNLQSMFQSLIDAGLLVKVMDEMGNSISNWGSLGGWINFIGDFVTGKGYLVRVNSDCTLIINEGGGKSATIGADQLVSGMMSMAVSANDGLNETPNGFIEGHDITLKRYSKGVESRLKTEVLDNGVERYKRGESLFLKIAGIPDLTKRLDVKFYPNPFTNEIAFEINSSGTEKIDLIIYDILGRKVRSLFQGTVEGKKILIWNGTNDAGDPLKSGIYFIRCGGLTFNAIIKT